MLSPVSVVALAAAVALLGLLAYGVLSNGDDSGIDEAIADGKRPDAPELTLPRLDGPGRASLADYRGKVVVLNFWASWCEPCRDEAPLLERWHRRIAPQGATVLGVDALDADDDAREFLLSFHITYPNVRDVSGERLRPFGIAAYPETFVIDRRGRIAALVRGPVDEEFLAREVPPLLREGT
ncbi:MAG TPA: TlpA disulfide reductase family protein [Thermoleophilaceae bacterium]|jgi:cytochrome c biogenesis protein CcmG/thiol:disulfide interchange protein DsbE